MNTNPAHEIVEIVLPKLGESILGATVVQWLKKEGDSIRLDEALVEVSTDKVNSEIPSPVAGVLVEIIAPVDASIEVGAPLARIAIGATAAAVQPELKAPKMMVSASTGSEASSNKDFFSPGLLRQAQQEGVSMETLKTLIGTGEGGRVTKKDLENFITSRQTKKTCPHAAPKAAVTPSVAGNEDRVKLSGMRKAIADNMVRSFMKPHASLVTEVDVTDAMQMIAKEKEAFQKAHGAKLTITAFLVEALTKALQKYPMLNASLVDETIVMKRYVNVGIAVHIEQGLVVPVIKNCHERSLASIAKEIADLSGRARSGKLAHDDVAGGTVTLTNFGMTGALIGIPIIRHPEVAIVGAGTIKKEVVVRPDDSFAIRQIMHMTLTFDHRIIDGIYGCEFLAEVKRTLEEPRATT